MQKSVKYILRKTFKTDFFLEKKVKRVEKNKNYQ